MQRKYNSAVPSNFGHVFMKRGDAVSPNLSTANVSLPPTDAELDAAFGGTAAQLNAITDPFVGIVDDNGAGTNVWLVVATNDAWFYEALSKAV